MVSTKKVLEDVKKNLEFAEKISNKFRVKFVYGGKLGKYLLTFVDNNGGKVDVRYDYWNNKFEISLPVEQDKKIELKYNNKLMEDIVAKKDDEYIVVVCRGNDKKLGVMRADEILYYTNFGYTVSQDGVVLVEKGE